jgi:hypothetical protein
MSSIDSKPFKLIHIIDVLSLNILRLYEMVAAENTIEDTIYYLSYAFNHGIIDLDTFMKVKSVAYKILLVTLHRR